MREEPPPVWAIETSFNLRYFNLWIFRDIEIQPKNQPSVPRFYSKQRMEIPWPQISTKSFISTSEKLGMEHPVLYCSRHESFV